MIFENEVIMRMNEQTVREEIIAPIITRLGYKFSHEFYAEREEHLPSVIYQLGRKGPKDFPIGKPDYRCGIDGRRGSFILEAKDGSRHINHDDIAQAHSYAAHGKINANFFILCNGQEFRIYETLSGVDADPILNIKNHDFEQNFELIEALLHPENLEKYASTKYDLSAPLIEGTQAKILKIRNGWLSTNELIIPEELRTTMEMMGSLKQLEDGIAKITQDRHPIVDGVLGRGADGKLILDVEFDASNPMLAASMITMGINSLKFQTDSEQLQNTAECISVFETSAEIDIPKGTELFSALSNSMERIIIPSEMSVFYRAIGSLNNNVYSGEYFGVMTQDIPIGITSTKRYIFETNGSFTLNVEY